MLILFDIDGTLLLTQGAGVQAMLDAGRELWGERFTIDGVEFSGRLDTLIWNDLTRINGVANDEANHDRFRAAYGRQLAQRLQHNPTARLLPGVRELVHKIIDVDHATLGLLTGNYPETGRLKIQSAGLDPDLFKVAAWGCDGKARRDLTPLAMKRHLQLTGRHVRGEEVVVIGDTPHDVDCAKAHGCRSIGVATGMFSVADLEATGADLAVETLADTAGVLRWMFESPVAVSE
ncbi:MAG TPA: HAD hydrolase-like protein [Phycisphaerales bacterium]|nr:HAD hydrolase-like protein [Phycisphaerales bacterium]